MAEDLLTIKRHLASIFGNLVLEKGFLVTEINLVPGTFQFLSWILVNNLVLGHILECCMFFHPLPRKMNSAIE